MPLQTSLSPQPTKLGPEPLVFYLWAAVAGDVVAVVVAGVGGGNLALGVQLPNTTALGALHCCTDQRGLSSTGSSHHQPQQWPIELSTDLREVSQCLFSLKATTMQRL